MNELPEDDKIITWPLWEISLTTEPAVPSSDFDFQQHMENVEAYLKKLEEENDDD